VGRLSPLQSLAASPTMVGAVTVLIAVVTVFLAYNANNGLPFVPAYRVSLDVPNAARLTPNNEVRIAGLRVGVIESIEPVRQERGAPTAQVGGGSRLGAPAVAARLNLRLDQDAEPLPKDSIFRVRYRSAFGLKYLEIVRGTGEPAPEGFAFDGTDDVRECQLPATPDDPAASGDAANGCFQEQTEFDDIGNTFDTPTREAARQNLTGYGDALAGRGFSLNLAIESLRPLLGHLGPVSRALTDPDTRLRAFFPALARTAAQIAPVADEQAELFGAMAQTFAAISSDPTALRETISEGVPTLQTGIETLPRQVPFLRDFTSLVRELRPGVSDLRPTLPVLNEAIAKGTPVLERSVGLNDRLGDVMAELADLVAQPSTKETLFRLRETFDEARPLLAHINPYQTVCNYWNYNWYNIWEHLSQRDEVGFLERTYPVLRLPTPLDQQGPLGFYSGIHANGKTALDGDPSRPGVQHVFDPDNLAVIHGPPYGQAADAGGRANCHMGQHGYPLGDGSVPGQAESNPAFGVTHYPGDPRGTTFEGRELAP
jgi:ABC-type transporter Mla subunit MlaD